MIGPIIKNDWFNLKTKSGGNTG